MTVVLSKLLVAESSTIKQAMRVIDLNAEGIAFLVTDDGVFAGVVTDGDIRRAILRGTNLDSPVRGIAGDRPIVIMASWSDACIRELVDECIQAGSVPDHGTLRIPILDRDRRVVDYAFLSRDRGVVRAGDDLAAAAAAGLPRRVLVVGGGGYLGSVLCPRLLAAECAVTVLDNLECGTAGVDAMGHAPNFRLIRGDVRDVRTVVSAIRDTDAVILLAGVVGDRASAKDPKQTLEVNYLATKLVIDTCKYFQVNRLVFASSCSVYGASRDPRAELHEKSPLNPVSLYAEMKIRGEACIREASDENFGPVILRMGTLYGYSPNMRFDLVVNLLTAKAVQEGVITVFGGQQWRPFLHVADAAEAYVRCLKAPLGLVQHETFNVASENRRVIDVGETIRMAAPAADLAVSPDDDDGRNYRVSVAKMGYMLGFETTRDLAAGVGDLVKRLRGTAFGDYRKKMYSRA